MAIVGSLHVVKGLKVAIFVLLSLPALGWTACENPPNSQECEMKNQLLPMLRLINSLRRLQQELEITNSDDPNWQIFFAKSQSVRENLQTLLKQNIEAELLLSTDPKEFLEGLEGILRKVIAAGSAAFKYNGTLIYQAIWSDPFNDDLYNSVSETLSVQ